MKVIHVVLDDEDYERLVEAKRSLGAKSWAEFLLKLLGSWKIGDRSRGSALI